MNRLNIAQSVRCYRSFFVALLAIFIWSCAPSSDENWIKTSLHSPAGAGSAEAHLAQGPAGEVVLSWLEPAGSGVALKHSMLSDKGWATPRIVSQGDGWFVNWADFPSVVPMSDRLWAAHWLAKRPGGTYSYDVVISISNDAGASWGKPMTPHTDGTRTEHGFVSLFPWQEGVGAMWLDGRNMGEDGHDAHASGASDPSSGMTLRSAVIGQQNEIRVEQLVDGLVCDCCQTDVAIARSGPVAAYRNRTEGEIRDIFISRAINGKWEAGRELSKDGWHITGCPVNGPAIDADGDTVVAAWFTAADDQLRVRFARSEDSGATFSTPIEIDTEKPLGRVDVVLLQTGDAVVTWLRQEKDKEAEIVMRLVSVTGEPGPVNVIATTAQSRTSGFPQMVTRGDDLVFAWTEVSGESTTVRTALFKKP